jgi:hypothetical protein
MRKVKFFTRIIILILLTQSLHSQTDLAKRELKGMVRQVCESHYKATYDNLRIQKGERIGDFSRSWFCESFNRFGYLVEYTD